MDLFEYAKSKALDRESPLASRLRPATLDEVVGQQHIIGKDTLLYRAIKADKLTSVIFYGPPGTGKTTLAKVIANTTSAEFTQINATVAGKKDMACTERKPSSSLMRSTASIKASRTTSFLSWKMELLFSSALQPKILILKSMLL